MTKKHFIALADKIRQVNSEYAAMLLPPVFSSQAISELADFCWRINPNFDRSRWLAYVNGECGPNGGPVKK